MIETKAIHKVTYRGTYFAAGSRDTKSYRITFNVPQEVVKNANVVGWFKEQLRTSNSISEEFSKAYPDFDRLCTHVIEDLGKVETI